MRSSLFWALAVVAARKDFNEGRRLITGVKQNVYDTDRY